MTLIKDAAFAAGVTLTGQIESASVFDLIVKLKPQDCGTELIRVGGDRDGGYLVPADLEGIKYCFSAGIGNSADFEDHLARLNIKSFLADFSVNRPPIERPEFVFDKKYLGANDKGIFFSIKAWTEKYLEDFKGDLLLKLDIEGSEYEALIATPVDVLSRFRIVVIEFHYLHKMFDSLIHRIYEACFERMLTNFHVAHIHPNNCCGSVKKGELEVPRVMEFTFYNKNRVARTMDKQEFPHPLDRDNVATKKPLCLPRCWYR
ncbi:MAG TPA: FkbM family methyltransferase [Terriglobales bacterium]|nr:FkbM family methyltransferase [Terriglobales bacterium]